MPCTAPWSPFLQLKVLLSDSWINFSNTVRNNCHAWDITTYNHLNILTTNSCNNKATIAYGAHVNNRKTLYFWKSHAHNSSNPLSRASDQKAGNSEMHTTLCTSFPQLSTNIKQTSSQLELIFGQACLISLCFYYIILNHLKGLHPTVRVQGEWQIIPKQNKRKCENTIKSLKICCFIQLQDRYLLLTEPQFSSFAVMNLTQYFGQWDDRLEMLVDDGVL